MTLKLQPSSSLLSIRCHSIFPGQVHRAIVKNKFPCFLSFRAKLKRRKIDFENHLPYFPPKFSADKKQDGGLTNYVLTATSPAHWVWADGRAGQSGGLRTDWEPPTCSADRAEGWTELVRQYFIMLTLSHCFLWEHDCLDLLCFSNNFPH